MAPKLELIVRHNPIEDRKLRLSYIE